MKILITGGCGFIGTHLIELLLTETPHSVVNIDCLTPASNPRWAGSRAHFHQYTFIQGDVRDAALINSLLDNHKPHAIVHLAAETRPDVSRQNPNELIHTNTEGTVQLLTQVLTYWQSLSGAQKLSFRLLNISAVDAYGELSDIPLGANDTTPLLPLTPYGASKAAADHFIYAWHSSFGLPTTTLYLPHVYGPYQSLEHRIPQLLANALHGDPITLYGDGQQNRDWLFIEDAVRALYLCLRLGKAGENYYAGSEAKLSDSALVEAICKELDKQAPEFLPQLGITHFYNLITHVDNPSGDTRIQRLDASKLHSELQWRERTPFTQGLSLTIDHYLHGDLHA